MVRRSRAHTGQPYRWPDDSRGLGALALCATAVTFLSLLSASASADPPPSSAQPSAAQQPAAQPGSTLDTVTVESLRQRELERQVSAFVSSITVRSVDESLARWQVPICPLVVGLPSDVGEFVRRRVSQVASEAGIPLGEQDCGANLLVVMTRDPETFLWNWWREESRLFNKDRGVGGIKREIRTAAPVRIFHNACSVPPGTSFVMKGGPSCGAGTVGSRLTWSAVRAIYSVIVVVDLERVEGLNIGQLTDFVAMNSLAQIRRNSELGVTPTILSLFDENDATRPQALSPWDQAFLKSLYGTDSSSVRQVSAIKFRMQRDLAP